MEDFRPIFMIGECRIELPPENSKSPKKDEKLIKGNTLDEIQETEAEHINKETIHKDVY